jgi:hypothetical protein
MPVIMQEEGAPVGDEGWVFIPLPSILVVFPSFYFLLRQPGLLLSSA